MTAAAAPVSPMDPRLALLVAAHDQTHSDLAKLTDEVQKNHDESSNRISLLETATEHVGARITAEVGLINRKLDDIERNGTVVKDHVILMTGKFGELDKKVTLLDERLTSRIDAMDEKFTSRIDGVDTRLDGIDGRLDGIDTRLEGIDTRLEGIDGRLEGIDGRLEGIDGRLDKMDTRLDGIDSQLGTIVELLTTEPRE